MKFAHLEKVLYQCTTSFCMKMHISDKVMYQWCNYLFLYTPPMGGHMCIQGYGVEYPKAMPNLLNHMKEP
jgi:hypothetical protein